MRRARFVATWVCAGLAAAAPAGAAAAKAAAGAATFEIQCAACHQPKGQGAPGKIPPLTGNRDLFRDRLFPVYVLLNGLAGPITVEGNPYNAQMPSFAPLPDGEIAAVINFVRGAWGNAALRPSGMAPIGAATVKHARAKPMTPAAVRAYRARLR